MSTAAVALACPRCAGEPDPEGGPGRLARCSRCGVLCRIEDPQGGNRLVASPAIEEHYARSAVQQELRDRGETGEFRAVGHEMLFAPFWRVESLVVGRLEGERQVASSSNFDRIRGMTERDDTSYNVNVASMLDELRGTRSEEVNKDLQGRRLAVIAACPLEELGLPTMDRMRQDAGGLGVRRPAESLGRVELFHSGVRELGTVLAPLMSRASAEEEADALLDDSESTRASGMSADRHEMTIVDRQVELLYYPVMTVRFLIDDRRGFGTVDAVTGKVVSLRYPQGSRGDERLHRRMIAVGSLFAGVIVGFAIRTMLGFQTGIVERLAVFTFAVIVLWLATSPWSPLLYDSKSENTP